MKTTLKLFPLLLGAAIVFNFSCKKKEAGATQPSLYQLAVATTGSVSTTGGTTGGTTGTTAGTSTGQATFYTPANQSCGTITVTCGGITKYITTWFTSSPACGTSGCANFTLAPGTYSYYASCSQWVWTSTSSGNSPVTVTANSCVKKSLN